MLPTQVIIDIGNTRIKLLPVVKNNYQNLVVFNSNEQCIEYIKTNKLATVKAIISSVRNKERTAQISHHFDSVIILNKATNIPIKNNYKTPHTLGKDRLANAIAANAIHPNQNNLIIDIGTCLKFDFINSEKEYLGGSISLGFSMRYKALHNFTDNLPLFNQVTTNKHIGTDTQSSIVSGVFLGMVAEIKQFISFYESKYKQLNIFLTGGDLSYFKNEELSQKNSIFADPLLTLKGLKVILDYNE